MSFVVTAKLICVFVFAYAKSRFSHDEAHMIPAILFHLLVINLLIYIPGIKDMAPYIKYKNEFL